MKSRGCFDRIIFVSLLLICFGGSSYFWFKFFVRGSSVATPNLIGMSASEARAHASDVGLSIELDSTKDRHSDQVVKEAVVWQNRNPGSLVKRGTRIIVGQSTGPRTLSVPDLSGQSPRTALLRFSQRNLTLGNVAYIDYFDQNGIISEDPPRGTVVAGETPVSLLVATPQPPQTYVMPDLIDRLHDRVRPHLEARGLKVTNVRFEVYPGIREGTIIRQFPLPGSPVSARHPITLVVSSNQIVDPEQGFSQEFEQ
jgi:eukaryotic-like serine/threonine-protein kinase